MQSSLKRLLKINKVILFLKGQVNTFADAMFLVRTSAVVRGPVSLALISLSYRQFFEQLQCEIDGSDNGVKEQAANQEPCLPLVTTSNMQGNK